jgi:filamentous hemagglutinin family protein
MSGIRRSLFLNSLVLASLGNLNYTNEAKAQITPDRSLGNESSVVNSSGDRDQINGGATRGTNLFHSFQDFNVDEGRSVYFSNPDGITNILTRVTGGNPSNILGTLGVNGNANLFLINPNGIIFGANARLDVGGSFLATTAESVLFENTQFSATNPQAPPLLTVNIPIGLRFRDNPGSISASSSELSVQSGNSLALLGGDINIDGGTLIAPGGRVDLGGLGEAGTVAFEGDLSFSFPEDVTKSDVSLVNNTFVDVSAGGGGSIGINARNVELLEESNIFAGIAQGLGELGAQAGNIDVNASENVELSNSALVNIVDSGAIGDGGDINIAAKTLSLASAVVQTSIFGSFSGLAPAEGNAGNILLNVSDSVTATGGGNFISSTFSRFGNAGNVTIAGRNGLLPEVSFDGATISNNFLFRGGIYTNVEQEFPDDPIRQGGNISIAARSLALTNGAQLSSIAFGNGNAGNIDIDVEGALKLDGISEVLENDESYDSKIITSLETEATGSSGSIAIDAGSLTVANGASIEASTFGIGNSGKIDLNVRDRLTIDGTGNRTDLGETVLINSGIFNDVRVGAIGNGGGINLQAGELSITNGAFVSSSTFSNNGALPNNAGDININVRKDVIFDGADTFYNVGGIIDLLYTFLVRTGVLSNVAAGANGNGGNITIEARRLSSNNGAAIESYVSRESEVTDLDTSSSTSIEAGIGNAGNITLKVSDVVLLRDGSYIGSYSSGFGNGGNVTITGRNELLPEVSFDGVGAIEGQLTSSGVFTVIEENLGFASLENTRRAGDIFINAQSLSLTNGASLSSSVLFASAIAGNINIDVEGLLKLDGISEALNTDIFPDKEDSFASQINTSNDFLSQPGENAGNINITSGDLSITNGAVIFASTDGNASFGSGNAGNVSIEVRERVIIDGVGTLLNRRVPEPSISGIFSRVEPGSSGGGGDVKIKARTLSITNGAQVESSLNNQLNIDSVPPELITDDSGRAGDITIEVADRFTIDGASEIFSVNGNNNRFASGISTVIEGPISEGRAGDIKITAGDLSITNGAQLLSRTSGIGNAGNVNINTRNNITLDGTTNIFSDGISLESRSGIQSNVDSGAIGNSGTIEITAGNLSILNGAQINASSSGSGDASNVNIVANDNLTLDGTSEVVNLNEVNNSFPSEISTFLDLGASGSAGEINIAAGDLSLTNGAQLVSKTSGTGNAGNVNINARNNITLDGTGNIFRNGIPIAVRSGIQSNVDSGALGDSGTIEITTGDLSILNGAQINASSSGFGDARDVNLKVANTLTLDGISEVLNVNGVDNSYSSEISTFLDIAAEGSAGNITLTAGELSITNGAQLVSRTSGTGNAGDININVRDEIKFDSTNTIFTAGFPILVNSGVQSNVAAGANGDGGNVTVNAGSIALDNFSLLSSATSSLGNAGNVSVTVDDEIILNNFSQISSSVAPGGKGIGGNIEVNGRSLSLTDGSQIIAFVSRPAVNAPAGRGRAGNLEVNATDFVEISGVNFTQFLDRNQTTVGFSSGLFASAERGTTTPENETQAAGNINVTTTDFRIADGAVVNALTSNDGSGGNVTINADTFEATSGGQVITTTRGSGRAGNISLKVDENITLTGSDTNFNRRIEQARQAGQPEDIVNNQGASSGIFANTAPNSTGDGGNIDIDPQTMVIQDGAGVAANSQGEGTGGSIGVQASNLSLNNGAFISAETASTTGGEINLRANELLTLRGNSNISATAGTEQAGGDGGNVGIETNFLIAFPGNNDITANAFTGSGGRVDITAEGIFGIESRDRLTPLNDITASSQFGTSGTVALNTPDTDPERGLVELPEAVSDPSDRIAQNPCRQGEGSQLFITGRGGVPENPNNVLSSDNVQVDLVEPVAPQTIEAEVTPENANEQSSETPQKAIAPAQGWVFNQKGEVVLTAEKPSSENSSRTPTPSTTTCPAP